MPEQLINASQAAKILGLTPRRIRQLCAGGDLQATKIGRDWVIDRDSVLAYKEVQGKKRKVNNETGK